MGAKRKWKEDKSDYCEYVKANLSEYYQIVWNNYLKENRYSTNEGMTRALSILYVQEPQDLRWVRKRIKQRVSQGIDKIYLNELYLLYNYLEHLMKILK
jgi:hypothetical protein